MSGKKHYSEDKEIYVKMPTQILRYSPVFYMNSIIERDETFENNPGSVVTVILKE